jgi:hypothetical protein
LVSFATVVDSRAVQFMTNENECLSTRRILRVTAEADPAALVRVLMAFQHLNVIPRRVSAELSTKEILHIEIHVTGLADDRLTLIAAKLEQLPMVMNAYWHR